MMIIPVPLMYTQLEVELLVVVTLYERGAEVKCFVILTCMCCYI